MNLMLFYDGSKTIQPRIQVPAPWFGSFISDKTGAEAGVEYVGSQYSRILAPFQEPTLPDPVEPSVARPFYGQLTFYVAPPFLY